MSSILKDPAPVLERILYGTNERPTDVQTVAKKIGVSSATIYADRRKLKKTGHMSMSADTFIRFCAAMKVSGEDWEKLMKNIPI